MTIIERISPVGPYLTHPVSAIVRCDPSEVASLPGVEWHGIAAFSGGEYRAHLVGRDVRVANAIMALVSDPETNRREERQNHDSL